MVKLMGILDLFAAALLLGLAVHVPIPLEALIIIPVCLFFKACICITDIGGITDLAVTALIVLSIFFAIYPLILYIGAAFIGLKGVMSLFA